MMCQPDIPERATVLMTSLTEHFVDVPITNSRSAPLYGREFSATVR